MKYFLALFCITSSVCMVAMESKAEHFDDVTQQVLKHYLSVIKENILNKDGINLLIHKNRNQTTILVEVENSSEAPLAKKLRSVANNSPKTSLTQCRARSWDVVHKSNEDYKAKHSTVELRPFEVTAQCTFNNEDFERYCNGLSIN